MFFPFLYIFPLFKFFVDISFEIKLFHCEVYLDASNKFFSNFFLLLSNLSLLKFVPNLCLIFFLLKINKKYIFFFDLYNRVELAAMFAVEVVFFPRSKLDCLKGRVS